MHPNRKILIVEDDEGIRNTLRLALELEGHGVLTAANGREGLDVLSRRPLPCVILLDLMMPVMNGWEFLDAVKKDAVLAGVPVVVVTAYSTQGIEDKVQGVIHKPIQLRELLGHVRRHCCTGRGEGECPR